MNRAQCVFLFIKKRKKAYASFNSPFSLPVLFSVVSVCLSVCLSLSLSLSFFLFIQNSYPANSIVKIFHQLYAPFHDLLLKTQKSSSSSIATSHIFFWANLCLFVCCSGNRSVTIAVAWIFRHCHYPFTMIFQLYSSRLFSVNDCCDLLFG